MAGYIQAHTQTGNDKSKLTYLRQTKSTSHGHIQWLTSKNHSSRTKYNLTEKNSQCNCDNRTDVFYNHGRIDHHSYRNKEDSTKQILYRSHQFLYGFRFNGFRQNGTHDERTKCR